MRVTIYVEVPNLPVITPEQVKDACQAGVSSISTGGRVSLEEFAHYVPNRNWRKRSPLYDEPPKK